MISCQDVVRELSDYLDGELPVERAARIADHLADCARCHRRYRFEYAFLAAVARQRSLGPGPSPALVEQVAGAILEGARGFKLRSALPSPRAPWLSAERWALAVLRLSLGAFLVLSSVLKLLAQTPAAAVSPRLWAAAAGFEACLGAIVVFGLWRRWTYGVTLSVHLSSMLVFWNAVRDPWGVMLAGLPTCGALIALYLLRDRDALSVDAWLAWRTPWRVVR